MRGTVVREQRGKECLHAPGASDRPRDGSSLLAAELVPSIATQDGTANSPRVARSSRKELTDAVPDLGACRMLRHFLPGPLKEKGESEEIDKSLCQVIV
jgi:hypothetical protein